MIETDQPHTGKYGPDGTVEAQQVFSQTPAPWQPIETAPRDGTEILVYRPRAHEHNDAPITVVRTTDRARSSPHGVEHYTDRAHHPTHWMPLPESPK